MTGAHQSLPSNPLEPLWAPDFSHCQNKILGISIMARGRRPKAPHLRLVEGTHRADRHGDAVKVGEAAAKAAANFGPLIQPMRAYMSALGLTDERNRAIDDSTEKDEFFDD